MRDVFVLFKTKQHKKKNEVKNEKKTNEIDLNYRPFTIFGGNNKFKSYAQLFSVLCRHISHIFYNVHSLHMFSLARSIYYTK